MSISTIQRLSARSYKFTVPWTDAASCLETNRITKSCVILVVNCVILLSVVLPGNNEVVQKGSWTDETESMA